MDLHRPSPHEMEQSLPGPSNNIRDSFNTAYSSLESTIRNFSKEKLMYQQQVRDLETKLTLAQEVIGNMNVDREEYASEIQNLSIGLSENEDHRLNLSTLMAGLEEKLNVMERYVHQFESINEGVRGRYEMHEEFVYCLKYQKLQLFSLFEESMKRKEATEAMLQQETEKLAILMNDLKEASVLAENQSLEYLQEKQRLIEEMENVKQSGETAIVSITRDKAQIEERLVEAVQKVETERKMHLEEQLALQSQLLESKAAFELKISGLVTEKNELLSSIEDIKTKMNGLTEKMNEEILHLEKEKAALQKDLESKEKAIEIQSLEFSEEKVKLLREHEERIKAALENLLEKSAVEKASLVEDIEKLQGELKEKESELKARKLDIEKLEGELKEKESELEAGKQDIEKLNTNLKEKDSELGAGKLALQEMLQEKKQLLEDFEQEKEYHHLNYKASHDELNQENERLKRDLRELRSRYSDQKHAIAKLVEETGVQAPALHRWKDSNDPTKQKAKVAPTPTAAAAPVVVTSQPVKPSPKPLMAGLHRRSTPIRSEFLKSPGASILKRSSNEMSSEKIKNVSFGPISIADFIISSGSSSEPDSSPLPEQTKSFKGKDSTTEKRQKLMEKTDEKNEKGNSHVDFNSEAEQVKQLKKPRRHIRSIVAPSPS